ncbi:MAG: nucleotidyl transferase AbiEii/AbiGii toxin family protein [Hydrogenovibrio sp.]|uniref:nucleotidyl transferase AbiEii/AbiGii toxin family protein n=1 Tax=Hydrogenovibrio sp. TaxID=2065821 RepID=UPI00287061E9|nr:nucleotidyl transferase AbiEii/AbiGii toxin family protein [Hydrogenovibrio sp.]MDR9500103.1 nucleotidyl transferase AbiEii/AbiGii toxin family protein [Hydrogenovibrio sp.]
MRNSLIDLRDKLPEGLVEVYQAVQSAASELQLAVLVVGAMARDLVLVHGFGAKLERGTRDVDFAVQVRDWTAYEKLAEGLVVKGFQKADKWAHRFYLQSANGQLWEVDVLPFGKVSDASGRIKWPPDESIEMTVLGFDEAFKHALNVQMGGVDSDFTVCVASPEAMSILKLISWLEREPAIRKKDARDLNYLMQTYCQLPDVYDRIYTEGDMEAHDWDQDKASAQILGRDAGNLIKRDTFDFLQAGLFSKPDKLSLLWNEMTPVMQEAFRTEGFYGGFQ